MRQFLPFINIIFFLSSLLSLLFSLQIKLLTNKLMFPFRLVCLRSKDGKALPSLVNDPSPEDYLAASQRKGDVPDYMK